MTKRDGIAAVMLLLSMVMTLVVLPATAGEADAEPDANKEG